MKRVLALILLFALALALVACGVQKNEPSTTTQSPDVPKQSETDRIKASDAFSVGRADLLSPFTEDEGEEILRAIAALSDKIGRGDVPYAEIDADYTALDDAYTRLLSRETAATVAFYLYQFSDADVAAYERAEEYVERATERIAKLYPALYDSVYAEEFFDGMTDEEIDDLLDEAAGYNEETLALERERTEIEIAYRALSDGDVKTEAAGMLRRMVASSNVLARLRGYENFTDYAYDVLYCRDYGRAEAAAFAGYVRTYLVPLLAPAKRAFEDAFDALSTNSQLLVASLLYEDADTDGFMQIVRSYAERVGGDYLDAYRALFDEGGGYFIGKDDTLSVGAAFTSYLYDEEMPVTYFGPGYRTSDTQIHEFGHYYAAARGGGLCDSVDLAEVHSQGNEWLFYVYLANEGAPGIGSTVCAYEWFEALVTIVQATIVSEFECAIYDGATGDFDALYKEICDSFGGYDVLSFLFGYDPALYWKLVAIDRPQYYISYAVSLLPALELYERAKDDFDGALACYLALCDLDAETDFLDALDAVGLTSPFDESVFARLAE